MIEDGEIEQPLVMVPGDNYDPDMEWPGNDSYASGYDMPLESEVTLTKKSKGNQPCFRLVVTRTSILPSTQKIAVLDSYHEVQFGRDKAPPGSVIPRIRLKEMDVSKLHATAYWDGARREWGIVDMGSKHGTFMTPAASSVPVRLSPPRVASIPRRLRHRDLVTIGSTNFDVHIHDNQLPCDECSPQGLKGVLKFAEHNPSAGSSSTKRLRGTAGLDQANTALVIDRDPKRALTMLRHSLLTRHDSRTNYHIPSSTHAEPSYVDRAARRRLLTPASFPDAPGVPSISTRTDPEEGSRPVGERRGAPVVSEEPGAIKETNIGHRLLLKQGWEPGTTLGLGNGEERSDERMALTEPIEIKAGRHRRGLGLS